MKKLIFLIILFLSYNIYSQQYETTCLMKEPDKPKSKSKGKSLMSCNTALNGPYYRVEDVAYIPNITDNNIHVRVNFIFLTKPDGTGNYQENNPDDMQFIDNIISSLNYRMGHLVNTNQITCVRAGEYGSFINDTKIRYDVNKVFLAHSGWDYVNGSNYNYNLDGPCATNTDTGIGYLYPWSSSFYLNQLNDDISNGLYPNIEKDAINFFFTNNGIIYDDLFVNQNIDNYIYTQQELDLINCNETAPLGHIETQGWAGSKLPQTNNLEMNSLAFDPDVFNKVYYNIHVERPLYYPNVDINTFMGWQYGGTASGIAHELGHSMGLHHRYYIDNLPDSQTNACNKNIMTQSGSSRNYLKPNQIGLMHRMLSESNIKMYATEDSFDGDVLNINVNTVWDLDWRIYSNVVVETGSELRITCKTIIPPQAQIIVQDGASLILDGGIIESADGQNWEGIQLEGSGYFEILQDTPEIENEYFYAYIESLKMLDTNIVEEVKKLKLENTQNKKYLLKVYPNPSNDFISIVSTNDFSSFEIFDLKSKNLVLHANHQGKASSLDISSFKKGVYLIKVFTQDKILYSKFIKD